MIQSKMIEKEEELQCSLKHKLPVLMIVYDEKLKRNERLLCSVCMENFDSKAQLMNFNKVLQDIEENQKQKQKYVENLIMISIKPIEELQRRLFLLKSNVVQSLDQIIGNLDEWIKQIIIIGQQNVTYNFYNELDNLVNQKRFEELALIQLIDQINQIQLSYNQKIEKKLNLFKSFSESQNCENILQQLRNANETKENRGKKILIQGQKELIQVGNEQKQLEQQLMKYKQVQFNLIDDSNQQNLYSYAIVFNKDESIMISCNYCQIKIWKFEQGRFKLSNTYNNHRNPVKCLIYSKQTNNFISGCEYHQIICWKQINQNEWKCSQPFEQHTGSVYCLLLNKQEDQLISGGDDKKIIVWKVDFIKNDLTFLYSLDQHTNSVESLSFNESETLLASCGYGELIIWEKGSQGNWEFKYILEQIKYFNLFRHIIIPYILTISKYLQIYNQFQISISLSIIKMLKLDIKFILLIITNFFGQLNQMMIFWYLNYRMEFLNRIQIKLFPQQRIMNVKIVIYFQLYIIKIEM